MEKGLRRSALIIYTVMHGVPLTTSSWSSVRARGLTVNPAPLSGWVNIMIRRGEADCPCGLCTCHARVQKPDGDEMIRMAHLRQQRSDGKSAELSGPNISGFDVGSKAEREERCMRCGGRSHDGTSSGIQLSRFGDTRPSLGWQRLSARGTYFGLFYCDTAGTENLYSLPTQVATASYSLIFVDLGGLRSKT